MMDLSGSLSKEEQETYIQEQDMTYSGKLFEKWGNSVSVYKQQERICIPLKTSNIMMST